MIGINIQCSPKSFREDVDQLKSEVSTAGIRFRKTNSIVFYFQLNQPIYHLDIDMDDSLATIPESILQCITDQFIDDECQGNDRVHIKVFDFNTFVDFNPVLFNIVGINQVMDQLVKVFLDTNTQQVFLLLKILMNDGHGLHAILTFHQCGLRRCVIERFSVQVE